MDNVDDEIQVYSDGPAQGGKVGAAAILIRKDKPDRTLHFHLGSESEHTVHEAELAGMLLALHLIDTEERNATTCHTAVDNQAALKAFTSDMRRPGHHLAREFLNLANRIQTRRGKRKFRLTLRWTAGHCGIEGNEQADSEAKKAASGITSTAKLLPPFLGKPLLMNSAATKRAYNDKLMSTWKADWMQSARGKRMKRMDSSTPSPKFLKAISNPKLSRNAASRIVQLHLQHAPLNSYLHRFKRVDKASCLACGDEEENIAHFLLHCPSYAYERWSLEKQVHKKRKSMMLETLLGDPELIILPANFIDGTNRFTFDFGEHT